MARLETYGEEITLNSLSNVYTTEPQGEIKDQPWFFNQVAHLTVDAEIWSAAGLLSAFLAIEDQIGRERGEGEEGGPRLIDIDMLTFGDTTMTSGFLDLPHPHMQERAFVLVPLKEIAPEFRFPDGSDIDSNLEKLDYKVQDNKIWQS